jgi:hypothetical protein
MPKQITNYDLEYSPAKNQGTIFVKFSDGTSAKVPLNSPEEFIAVALVLSHSPVILRDDGFLEYKS